MKKVFCDRCGTEIKNDFELSTITIGTRTSLGFYDCYDVCPKCIYEFKEWLSKKGNTDLEADLMIAQAKIRELEKRLKNE